MLHPPGGTPQWGDCNPEATSGACSKTGPPPDPAGTKAGTGHEATGWEWPRGAAREGRGPPWGHQPQWVGEENGVSLDAGPSAGWEDLGPCASHPYPQPLTEKV